MIKIEIIFTETEAARLLARRGMNIQERDVVHMDGGRELPFRQLQVQNPFSCTWEPVESAFRRMAEVAGCDLITERMMIMNLAECFKNE